MKVTPPRRRRGATLAVVAGLILVISVGVLVLHRLIRQQHLDAHRYTWGEVATNIAESGLNLTMEHLRTEAVTPGTPFYALLLESSVEDIEAVTFPVEAPEPLESVLEAFRPGDAELEITIEFRNFRRLHPSSGLRGVLSDGREKYGELSLVSRARYRGVVRTMVAAKQVRVVNVTAPVLSKFTLFVRERGEDEVNLLRYRRTEPGRFTMDDRPAHPLVLYHRTDQMPAVVDGRFYPLSTVLEDKAADDAGLVYLGGRRPWHLNLVHGLGASAHEEGYQLRRTRYLLEDPETEGAESEVGMAFGLYDGVLSSQKMGSGRSPGGTMRRQDGSETDDRTSALHLAGDVFHVTPTVALGPVFRSYLKLRLVDGLWFPYQDAGEFAGSPQRARFSSYDAYRRVMVRVEAEPYNRSWDHMVTNQEELQADGTVVGNGTPFHPGPELVNGGLRRVGPAAPGDEAFAYPVPGEEAPGYCTLARVNGSGELEPFFQGALADVDGVLLEKILLAKAVYRFADQAALKQKCLRYADLRVPGVVYVEDGELELGSVNVREGGMIVTDGSIAITGRIVQAEAGQPLTLVSLHGDIEVRTGDKVDAHLVALEGTLRSRGRLNLVGGLAVGRLDLERMVAGEEPKVITYNRDLDPSWTESYWKNLRVVLDSKVRTYLRAELAP